MQIYADCADPQVAAKLTCAGFTTNPLLMLKAGYTKYSDFVQAMLNAAAGRPVSFQVTSDEPSEICRQAEILSRAGANVWVKVPIVTSGGGSLANTIRSLRGIQLNVTAVLTKLQAYEAMAALGDYGGVISVFAGRVADCGVNPEHHLRSIRRGLIKSIKLLWASVREASAIVAAENAGCDIVTAPPATIERLRWLGRDLTEVSVATVAEFVEAGRNIECW